MRLPNQCQDKLGYESESVYNFNSFTDPNPVPNPDLVVNPTFVENPDPVMNLDMIKIPDPGKNRIREQIRIL
jgi:hypothetical protein